jgi:hypothetical protein
MRERDCSSGTGSRLRSGSKQNQGDLYTPSKPMSSKDVAVKANPSLSSSDTNIVSLKNQGAARNIKTPQSKKKDDLDKPTRLSLKMLSQSKKANISSS